AGIPAREIAEAGREAAERREPRGARVRRDDRLARQSREPRDVVEVLAAVDDLELAGATPALGHGVERDLAHAGGRSPGIARPGDGQEHRARGGDLVDLAERLGGHAGVEGHDLVEPAELDDERPVACPAHALDHAKLRTRTPAPSSASRTARAIATDPGVSPCTQMLSASTATSEPSTARTTPSSARRRMRSATARASCSTAPSCERGTSVPSGR